MSLPATLGAPTTLAREGASLAVSGLLALLLAMVVQPKQDPEPPEPVEPVSVEEAAQETSAQPTTVVLPAPPAVPQSEAPTAEPLTAEPSPSVEVVEPAEDASEDEAETAMPSEPDLATATVPKEPSEFEAPAPSKVQQTLGRKHVEHGRPLLLLLEAGQGPAISIDWPHKSLARERLATRLGECYGVELALLSDDGALYRLADPRGGSQSFDLDRWSGFLRMPSGQLSAGERQMADALRARHALPRAQIVRLFPRAVDAALLGGLGAILGARYQNAETIRLAYELTENGRAPVAVQLLAVDDEPGGSRLSLPAQQRCVLG